MSPNYNLNNASLNSLDGGEYESITSPLLSPSSGSTYTPSLAYNSPVGESPRLPSTLLYQNAPQDRQSSSSSSLDVPRSGKSIESVRSGKSIRPREDIFDFVIVCSGHHWKPNIPDFKNMDTFTGRLIHSHSYRVPYPYKNERVLVVGVGNSGLDISSEISLHSSIVHLSSRTGTWVVPKTTFFGTPLDHLETRATHLLPKPLLNFAMQSLLAMHHGDLKKYGLGPKHEYSTAYPSVNDSLLPQIQAGKVKVHGNVSEFKSNSVVFEDKTEVALDAVVLCTGYLVESPFLDSYIMGKMEDDSNRVRLYKHVFPPSFINIAFIGLVQPPGSVLPYAEMQSRWVAKVFSGKTSLPAAKEMRDVVDIDWQKHCGTYIPRERHAIQVDAEYLETLAGYIGCQVIVNLR